MNDHPKKAAAFLKDEPHADWHDQTLWWVRQNRDKAVNQVEEWEKLRGYASQIKEHTLGHLDQYLEQFEKNALQNGIKVHWANDSGEHNSIILSLLEEKQIPYVVKSKSMLTEECGLNSYLESKGIEVIDTDLGERIIQWMEQKPSHIVLPAIHLKKKEIGEIFTEKLKIPFTDHADTLTQIARDHLRKYFLSSKAAISGVNFGIADTGSFVICTNEGNADMGIHLADMHIASIGIEKIIPEEQHLGVFLRILSRSATGQPITTYSSHFKQADKNKEIHLIIVDNGRSEILGKPKFWKALKCIRCGACLNTCPVFRKSGGHSYDSIIPGPIGAILAPHKDPEKYRSLPFASSLCGSCSAVCPVKIDIDDQLFQWRQELNHKRSFNIIPGIMGKVLERPGLFDATSNSLSFLQNTFPGMAKGILFHYTKGRDLPKAPKQNFKSWYKQQK